MFFNEFRDVGKLKNVFELLYLLDIKDTFLTGLINNRKPIVY